MSVRNLNHLFAPRSLALIGAVAKPAGVPALVLRNIKAGGFRGPVAVVDAATPEAAHAARFDAPPDLGIICAAPAVVPVIVAKLGEAGTRAAIVLSAGLGRARDTEQRLLRQAMLDAANPYLLRLLGPDSAGLLVPSLGLNASVSPSGAFTGRIGFVSQSGALMTGVLDWARSRGVGFSRLISLGDSADVDLGDVLDYLASDGATAAIMVHAERVRYARKFMSAARAAARAKPTLVLKTGRAQGVRTPSACVAGTLAGVDDIYDAAIRRAGMLRVFTTEELFAAVETLAHARPQQVERLAIISNGSGPGAMAADALVCSGGAAARLSPATLQQLDALLAPGWSRGNPVDLPADARPECYGQALEIVLRDPAADAALLIHAPSGIVDGTAVADAVVPVARATSRNVLTAWLGGEYVAPARGAASSAGIPAYGTPEDAVAGFLQIVHYRQNQALLMQVPPSIPGLPPDSNTARALVRDALAAGRHLLSDPETKAILDAYGIPVVRTRVVAGVEDAVTAAMVMGLPVAVKLVSPDVAHRSDVGGVALDLDSAEAVRAAAGRMLRRLGRLRPGARLEGFAVQPMARRPEARELLAGVATDMVFGPVIVFGQGGMSAEVAADHAVALPPLNHVLARDLVRRTRVARLLEGYRNVPAVDMEALLAVLVQLARLVADIPEIVELDINPLLADSQGVVALDTRMRLAMADQSRSTLDRLAIRPYPRELEEVLDWQGQPLMVRPIRPEDGPAHIALFNALTPDDVRYRMFVRVRELTPSQLARFTQIDYDREMAFVAVRADAQGKAETLGVGRVVADPDNVSAEFAVVVRSDLKGAGLGKILMQKLIDYCRSRGTREIVGEALPQNARVIALARHFGFEVRPGPEGGRELRLQLR